MVKIRLSQTGAKNRRQYRIVVSEEAKKRDGKAIEIIGYYNPLVKPPELIFQKDRVSYWLKKGAQPTDSIRKLLKL